MIPRSRSPSRKGKTMASVLITGTSSGIGMATALAFGRAGHKVAATMRNPQRAPELARITAQEKLPITISAMDVDSDASVKEGIGRIVRSEEHTSELQSRLHLVYRLLLEKK